MSSVGAAGPRAGAYGTLVLSTLAFALSFAVWGLVSPLATRFQELYELSSTQISVVIATPVILGSLFRIPMGLLTDRFGGRAVFSALMFVLIVPVLFIGLRGGSFGGLLFWGVLPGDRGQLVRGGGISRTRLMPRRGVSSVTSCSRGGSVEHVARVLVGDLSLPLAGYLRARAHLPLRPVRLDAEVEPAPGAAPPYGDSCSYLSGT